MRNKPAKLYLLLDKDGQPYMRGGQPKAFNSPGKALKVSKQLYSRTATLYTVVKAGLV